MTFRIQTLAFALAAFVFATHPATAGAGKEESETPKTPASKPAEIFATVDDVRIDATAYEQALRLAARQKFYHGSPPEAQVDQLRRDVGLEMIDRILLQRAAKARGIGPDAKAVDEKIAGYEARYKDSPRWQQQREATLPGLRAKLEEDSILANLEAAVRTLPPAKDSEIRKFYESHPDKFTEPEKLRLAIILLKVDPSSTTEIWNMARDEAQKLYDRIKAGEDFAELAKRHSSEESASNGGDMGYLHRGMIPSVLEEKVDAMKVGEVSEPQRILEGIAIFKVLDRKQPIHHTYDRVKARATELHDRQRKDDAWESYKLTLRKKAHVSFNTGRYPVFANFDPAAPVAK